MLAIVWEYSLHDNNRRDLVRVCSFYFPLSSYKSVTLCYHSKATCFLENVGCERSFNLHVVLLFLEEAFVFPLSLITSESDWWIRGIFLIRQFAVIRYETI